MSLPLSITVCNKYSYVMNFAARNLSFVIGNIRQQICKYYCQSTDIFESYARMNSILIFT